MSVRFEIRSLSRFFITSALSILSFIAMVGLAVHDETI